MDSRRTSDFISLKVEVEDDLRVSSSAVNQTAIATKVGKFIIDTILAHAQTVYQGNYTNSTHVLACSYPYTKAH